MLNNLTIGTYTLKVSGTVKDNVAKLCMIRHHYHIS